MPEVRVVLRIYFQASAMSSMSERTVPFPPYHPSLRISHVDSIAFSRSMSAYYQMTENRIPEEINKNKVPSLVLSMTPMHSIRALAMSTDSWKYQSLRSAA